MEITDLPPGPAPAPLTARRGAGNLADHLAGFRAANGFAPDEPDHPALLFLEQLQQCRGLAMEQFKRDAFTFKDLCGKQVKLGNVHQLLAAALGYKTFAAMQAASKGKPYVKNISE